MNRNVFKNNNKKSTSRSSGKETNYSFRKIQQADHRLPGQKSIEKEFETEPISTRAGLDIDWEAYGIPVLLPKGHRGSTDPPGPEILSDELLAIEDAVAGIPPVSDSSRGSEDSSFQILNLDSSRKPSEDDGTVKEIMKKVSEMGIQKQGENPDSEGQGFYEAMGQDSGTGRQDSPRCLNSGSPPSGVNRRNSGVRGQFSPRHQNSDLLDSEANNRFGGEYRHFSADLKKSEFKRPEVYNDPYFLKKQDSESRCPDDQCSIIAFNGSDSGSPRRQDSGGRQDCGQDSPRRQEDRGFRSPAPNNGGHSGRRQDSGDRQDGRQGFGSHSRSPDNTGPSGRRQDRRQDDQCSMIAINGSDSGSPRRQDSGGRQKFCQDSPRCQEDRGFRNPAPNDGGFSGRRLDSGDRQDLHRDSPRRQDGPRFRNGSRSPAQSNGGPSGRRQDSEDRQNHRQDLHQDSPRRHEDRGFRSPAPSNGRPSGRRQDSGNRQDRRQDLRHDSPRHQDGPRFRSRSRSPYNEGPSKRRSRSPDRRREPSPPRQGPSGDRPGPPGQPWSPYQHPNDNFNVRRPNPDRHILSLLKGILPKILWARAMRLRQILVSIGHHEIYEFMDDQKSTEDSVTFAKMDQILNGLEAVLSNPNLRFSEANEMKGILEEGRGHEVWEFMSKKFSENANQRNQEDRRDDQNRDWNRQSQDRRPEDRNLYQQVDNLINSPESRQNQMNNRGDFRPASRDGQYRSPDRQRRDFSADRRDGSPIRDGPYRPDSPDRRDDRQYNGNQNSINFVGNVRPMSPDRHLNHSNQNNSRNKKKRVDWVEARLHIKKLLDKKAKLSEFNYLKRSDIRRAIVRSGYHANELLTEHCEELKAMKARGLNTIPTMMNMLRYESKTKENHRTCVIWMSEIWKAGT